MYLPAIDDVRIYGRTYSGDGIIGAALVRPSALDGMT
jgi:hypothetical protein